MEKENGEILRMGHDYEGIGTDIKYSEITGGGMRPIECGRRIYKPVARETKAGIKRHLSWRDEQGKARETRLPYCPSTFSILGALSRHI